MRDEKLPARQRGGIDGERGRELHVNTRLCYTPYIDIWKGNFELVGYRLNAARRPRTLMLARRPARMLQCHARGIIPAVLPCYRNDTSAKKGFGTLRNWGTFLKKLRAEEANTQTSLYIFIFNVNFSVIVVIDARASYLFNSGWNKPKWLCLIFYHVATYKLWHVLL